MKILRKIFTFGFCAFALYSCDPYANLTNVRAHAKQRWESMGWTYVGDEGYQMGFGLRWLPYGGANVWATLTRGKDGTVYTGYL